jgi:hypothetical protein
VDTAWTYSRLEAYETCPKKFYHRYVKKDYPDPPNEHNIWGNRVHEALENRVKNDTPLPEGMTQWEKFMQKALALPGEKLVEEKLALDTSFRPTDWKGAWTRGKADLLIVNGKEAAALDFKTGKVKVTEQLTLYAAYTFAHYPEVNIVHTGFVWLKEKRVTTDVVERKALPFIWQSFVGRVAKLETSYETDNWPERPSGLCRGWCPVNTCKYWKPKK